MSKGEAKQNLPHVHLLAVGVAFLILAVCEVLLIVDVVSETLDVELRFFTENHTLLEWLAVLGLGFTAIFVGTQFHRALLENRRFRSVSDRASGEFLRVVVRQLDEWELSD